MKVGVSTQYMGKKVLITGGNGYLASNLIQALKNVECTILRLNRPGKIVIPIDGICKCVDIHGDFETPIIWEEFLDDVDIIYHFAAQTSTYVSNADPVEDIRANVLPILLLLETCKKKGLCPIFCFAGSVTEVGIPQENPVDETHLDAPVTIYDIHKQMSENYLKFYVQQGFVKGVTLRLPNIYGPGPKSSSADRGILNMMMKRALKGETLTVYGSGEYVRDYLHVDDAVRAFLEAPLHMDEVNGKHFVIGTGEGHSIAEAMNLIKKQVKQKEGMLVSVTHIEPPTPQSPIESRNFVANSNNFHTATGWVPRFSLKEGINQTLDFFTISENQDQ